MKSLFLILVFLLAGCSGSSTIQLIPGPAGPRGAVGPTGSAGANGHSLVSQFVEVDTDSLECATGGTRLDIFLDLDDTLTVSENDVYMGSLVACNGANGLDGLNGQDGLNGSDGQDGANGTDGLTGQPGPQGVAGPQGDTGPQGVAGPVGPEGPQGLQGATGAQGPAGEGATVTAYSSTACIGITGTSFFEKATLNSVGIYTSSTCASNTKQIDLNKNSSTFWLSQNSLGVFAAPNTLRVIRFN